MIMDAEGRGHYVGCNDGGHTQNARWNEERVAFAEAMEKWYRAEFEYYAGRGQRRFGGREVGCLGLPTTVLEKFYHGNAQCLMPGLKPG